MSETLKRLKPPRRTASLLLQHMVDKLAELTSVRRAVNYLLAAHNSLGLSYPTLLFQFCPFKRILEDQNPSNYKAFLISA